jgi:hypothetical protein
MFVWMGVYGEDTGLFWMGVHRERFYWRRVNRRKKKKKKKKKKKNTERRRFEKIFTRVYFDNMQSPKRRSFDFSIHFHGNNEWRGPKYNCLVV